MATKRTRLKLSYYITLFTGITAAYLIWLIWKKLTEFIGDGWLIFGITGGIVLIAIITGYFSIDKIVKRFI